MLIKRLNKNFEILDKHLIAHKGIYGYSKKLKKYVTPNSYTSCKFAIDNDIPFECDIRNTADDIAVLAHDNIILHEGQKIKVNKYKYEELVNILGSKAPTKLEDVLSYNKGKVGVIVDAKEAHIFYSKYRDKLANLLNKYSVKGEILLQSFNPFFMLSIRKHLKGVLTGQLICRGKTILESFRTPKRLANIYEMLISFICFIARTDVINMENHSDAKWQVRTRFFISKKENLKVKNKRDKLLEKLDHTIYKGIKKLNKFTDKIQLQLVKIAHELTKKPVLAFTITHEDEFDVMENLYIVNYIADFSMLGVEEYIEKIKRIS